MIYFWNNLIFYLFLIGRVFRFKDFERINCGGRNMAEIFAENVSVKDREKELS